jgi:hypothetical protein
MDRMKHLYGLMEIQSKNQQKKKLIWHGIALAITLHGNKQG